MSSDENCIEILEPDLCIICLDNNKSLNSLPCLNNHNALICSECKSTLEGHPCVLCRMVPNEYLPREPTTVRVTDIVVTTRSIRPKRFLLLRIMVFYGIYMYCHYCSIYIYRNKYNSFPRIYCLYTFSYGSNHTRTKKYLEIFLILNLYKLNLKLNLKFNYDFKCQVTKIV